MDYKASTDRTVTNWNSFSIGSENTVNFNLPDANSAVLNRVVGADPSIINGNMWSHGHVYLINKSGILFGKGSKVNVNGLVASSLDISSYSINKLSDHFLIKPLHF